MLCIFLSLTAIEIQAASIQEVTNNTHTRIAWIKCGDRLNGGGALWGFDSKNATK